RISAITNGTLYQNDGTTQINNGDYITFAQGNTSGGVKFLPASNTNTSGSFTVKSSQNVTSVAAQSGTATSTITITPVGDTPTVENITTLEDTLSGAILISRNASPYTTLFRSRISAITNGTLYQNDGTTQINNGDYITFAQGNTSGGVKFL